MPSRILRCCICGRSRKVGAATYGLPKGVDILLISSRFPTVIFHSECGYAIRTKARKEVGDIADSTLFMDELIPESADSVRKG